MTDTPDPPKAPVSAKTVHQFTCPACGGQIEIRAVGYTVTAICAHCSSVIDVSNEDLKIIQKASAENWPTLLPIGARGTLLDTLWEVIGYTQKVDKTEVYHWDEYLLFNPTQGFRFLIQQDGHWSFATILKREVKKSGFNTDIFLDGIQYRPFLRDMPKVTYVKGEFYWRVRKGDGAITEDYVAPPHMLSFEHTNEDVTLTQCDYVEPSVIEAAFKPARGMPSRSGVAPNQPAPEYRGISLVAVCALALVTLVQIVTASRADNQEISSVTTQHKAGDQSSTFSSPPLEITKKSNILVKSMSPVDNQWVELNISLVNDATGAFFDTRHPIEYYHGYDSDGAWTEGSQSYDSFLSAVPPGNYHMAYEIDAGAFAGYQPVNIGIFMTRDVVSWGNYWWTVLLILAYPGLLWSRRRSFEGRRWANSDFAPQDDR